MSKKERSLNEFEKILKIAMVINNYFEQITDTNELKKRKHLFQMTCSKAQ